MRIVVAQPVRQRPSPTYAEYHLRGGGGYALTKYEGTGTKMKPVMDQLLAEYPAPVSVAASAP